MEYKVTNVQRGNEWRSKYATGDGNDMVDYAVVVEANGKQEGWAKLSQKATTAPPVVGGTLTGRIEEVPGPNGMPYKRFKKENPSFQQRAAPVSNEKLDYIVTMLEELTGRRKVHDKDDGIPIVEDDPFAGLI